MSYLRYRGGVVTYPFSLSQLKKDNPNVSFPSEISAELLLQFDVFAVEPTERPDPSNAITKNVVEADPEPVNGVWTQQWVEVDATEAQIAARTQEATDETHRQAVKGDNWVKTFIAMTPSEVADYIDANVTNLATAKTVITKMGQMLLLLVRREYRNGAGA